MRNADNTVYRLIRPLPHKRAGQTQSAVVAGHHVIIRTSTYPDGRLGELCLEWPTAGETVRSLLSAVAEAITLGLQHGVPLAAFVDTFVGSRFTPAGVVEGHSQIAVTTSVLDFVFRDLGITALGRQDLIVSGECPIHPTTLL